MNDHTLAGAPGRCSPPAQAILRFGVASTVGLLLILCLFLAGRRFGGAFDQPLGSLTMLLLGLLIAALAGCLRSAWPRAENTHASVSSLARLLLPSLAVFLFCYALSLPGSAPWALALMWFLVVSEEGAWWLADSLALQTGRQRTAVVNRSALVSNSHDNQPRLDPTSVVASDVTQQITRMRDAEGSDLVFGQARAEFTPGERSQIIHLAFCPPLADSPRITVMQADGPSAVITIAQAETFGARFDILLGATARQAESVMIEFEARCLAASDQNRHVADVSQRGR
ncbi:MAG: hypothetical protein QF918_11345 [Pirellulaceae bacterium]|jgi:hypothetical protein|nr:hypothetical protein [Pirellulaceae bacterium]MDP6554091.1 hypothetical protein [Pirellulaceae bacterium]MDP6723415.1 hypothetical protein [Pirellulaceae bacterium]